MLCEVHFYTCAEYSNHVSITHDCYTCGKSFLNLVNHHCVATNQVGRGDIRLLPENFDTGGVYLTESRHGGSLLTFTLEIPEDVITFEGSFSIASEALVRIIGQLLATYGSIKTSISIHTTLEKIVEGTLLRRKFFGPFIRNLHVSFISKTIEQSLDYLNASLEVMSDKGSGYKIKQLHSLEFRSAIYQPSFVRGGSFMPTPKEIRRKSVINVQSPSGQCFIYGILAGLYHDKIYLPGEEFRKKEMLNYADRAKLK
jgi:hypothetical protein